MQRFVSLFSIYSTWIFRTKNCFNSSNNCWKDEGWNRRHIDWIIVQSLLLHILFYVTVFQYQILNGIQPNFELMRNSAHCTNDYAYLLSSHYNAAFWNKMEESKLDGSRMRAAHVNTKFHSLPNHFFFSSLLELSLGYPASVPEFPVDPAFPGMVNVLFFKLSFSF